MAQTYEDKPTLEAWNALGSPFKLIREVVMEEEGRSLSISIDNIDWSSYALVCIVFEPVAHGETVSINVAEGGGPSIKPYTVTGDQGQVAAQAWLQPFYSSDFTLTYSVFGSSNPYQYTSSTRISAMTRFDARMTGASGNIKVGSRIRIYGIQ